MKLLLVGGALSLGGAFITFGVLNRTIEPVVMIGVVGGLAPFWLAWITGNIERWKRGPILIPSAPSLPASDSERPRIPVAKSTRALRRSLRNISRAQTRREVHTKLPY